MFTLTDEAITKINNELKQIATTKGAARLGSLPKEVYNLAHSYGDSSQRTPNSPYYFFIKKNQPSINEQPTYTLIKKNISTHIEIPDTPYYNPLDYDPTLCRTMTIYKSILKATLKKDLEDASKNIHCQEMGFKQTLVTPSIMGFSCLIILIFLGLMIGMGTGLTLSSIPLEDKFIIGLLSTLPLLGLTMYSLSALLDLEPLRLYEKASRENPEATQRKKITDDNLAILSTDYHEKYFTPCSRQPSVSTANQTTEAHEDLPPAYTEQIDPELRDPDDSELPTYATVIQMTPPSMTEHPDLPQQVENRDQNRISKESLV